MNNFSPKSIQFARLCAFQLAYLLIVLFLGSVAGPSWAGVVAACPLPPSSDRLSAANVGSLEPEFAANDEKSEVNSLYQQLKDQTLPERARRRTLRKLKRYAKHGSAQASMRMALVAMSIGDVDQSRAWIDRATRQDPVVGATARVWIAYFSQDIVSMPLPRQLALAGHLCGVGVEEGCLMAATLTLNGGGRNHSDECVLDQAEAGYAAGKSLWEGSALVLAWALVEAGKLPESFPRVVALLENPDLHDISFTSTLRDCVFAWSDDTGRVSDAIDSLVTRAAEQDRYALRCLIPHLMSEETPDLLQRAARRQEAMDAVVVAARDGDFDARHYLYRCVTNGGICTDFFDGLDPSWFTKASDEVGESILNSMKEFWAAVAFSQSCDEHGSDCADALKWAAQSAQAGLPKGMILYGMLRAESGRASDRLEGAAWIYAGLRLLANVEGLDPSEVVPSDEYIRGNAVRYREVMASVPEEDRREVHFVAEIIKYRYGAKWLALGDNGYEN